MRLSLVLALSLFAALTQAATNQVADGYRGIWYFVGRSQDEYKYKYSGGFATYPQQQTPIAIYRKEVNKTFFCYGGTTANSATDKQDLLHMISYYDHSTGEVPRPTLLMDKHTGDAHENPTMAIDEAGYIWIFSSSHGARPTSYISKSEKPYSIDSFRTILKTNFSYSEPWYWPGKGFFFAHTHYIKGERNLFWMTSADGENWSDPQKMAKMEMGDYQSGWFDGTKFGTAFDFHPHPLGLDGRANIYYLETRDFGKTWLTVDGKTPVLPLTNTNNIALVLDSRIQNKLVYMKDVNFDAAGHPVIMFLTSKGHQSGPSNGPRQWQTAHWRGTNWEFRNFTTSLNNYDYGPLYIEPDGTWRVIAPTEPGPQPYNPGGEMVLWTSADEGATWKKVKQLTHDSPRNHTYARRPVNANPEFYALWADGNGRAPSESFLYFTDKKGSHVWRLPAHMTGATAKPEIAW